MKLDEADLENSYFEPTARRVDKSVGYVLIGLVVILCFSFFVFGMNRIQTVSDQTVESHSRSSDRPTAEISDTVDPAKN